MDGMGKKIIIFIVLMILIIGVANVLFRFVLPIKPVKLISGNMEPTHNSGEVLFYGSSNDYKVDDIIIYKPARNPSVVRIIEINDDGTYKAKGDNNPISISRPDMDETHIQKEQIIGKVSFGTKWYIFYSLSYGIQIIIALLLTQLIYSKLKK